MRAREIMTKSVLTVRRPPPSARLRRCSPTADSARFPVVDENGTLVGIVTEADLIRNRFPQHSGDPAAAGQSPARTVAEVMTTPAVAVSHDEDLSVLARVMLADHRRCVPVVDGTRLVGVVTRRDMVRVLSRTDAEIAADVRKNLQVLGGQARWSVQVTDGEVVVRDLFDRASDRPVAQVLAEAVPGVIRAEILSTEPKPPVQGGALVLAAPELVEIDGRPPAQGDRRSVGPSTGRGVMAALRALLYLPWASGNLVDAPHRGRHRSGHRADLVHPQATVLRRSDPGHHRRRARREGRPASTSRARRSKR